MAKSSVLFAQRAGRGTRPCKQPCVEVPRYVFSAVASAMDTERSRDGRSVVVGRVCAKEGWRFCQCYRNEITPAHAVIERIVNTTTANAMADQEAPPPLAMRTL